MAGLGPDTDQETPARTPEWLHRALKRLRSGVRWMNHPRVRRGTTILLSAVSAVSFGAILYANWDLLHTFEWQLRPLPLVLSFVAYSIALALAILGWGRVLQALGSSSPWAEHIRVYCVTNLARRLPGVLWYVVGRLVLYEPRHVSKVAVSVGSALELFLTGLSGLVLGMLLWPGIVKEVLNPYLLATLFSLSLLAIHPKVVGYIFNRLEALRNRDSRIVLSYRQMLGWFLLYTAIWLSGGLVIFGLIQSLSPVPLDLLIPTIGAWSLSGMISVLAAVLPVGFGLRELALGLLLANFLPEGVAIVVAILARLLLTLYELVWALAIQWREGKITRIILR
jgi:glycosyltransferase 2 family protein